jgi:hypothetical protein
VIEVKIPAEIDDYKEKVIFGLTIRQVASIGGALVVGIPIGVFGGNVLPADLVQWCVILAVAPIIAWGFATYKGMRFEEFVKVMFMFYFLPQKRVYEDTDVNYLCHIHEELMEEAILRQRIENGEADEDELYTLEDEDNAIV